MEPIPAVPFYFLVGLFGLLWWFSWWDGEKKRAKAKAEIVGAFERIERMADFALKEPHDEQHDALEQIHEEAYRWAGYAKDGRWPHYPGRV